MQDARIGVTASRRGAELVASLQRRGALVVHGPTLDGDHPVPDAELVADTRMVLDAEPDWLVATTGVGMRLWAGAADRAGLGDDLRALAARATCVARGAKAVGGLAALGQQPVWTSPSNTDRDVAGWLRGRVLPGQTVAVQLHGGGPRTYDEVLGDVDLVSVMSYRWGLPDDTTAARELVDLCVRGQLDVITFTSAGAVLNLVTLARQMGDDVLVALREQLAGPTAVAVIGPVTAEAVETAGGRVQIVPRRWRTADLLRALDAWWDRRGALDATVGVHLHPGSSTVTVGDVTVSLGPREYAVLAALSRRSGTMLRAEELVVEAWGHEAPGDPTVVKHQVARLRRKLAGSGVAIATVRGAGYRLDRAG